MSRAPAVCRNGGRRCRGGREAALPVCPDCGECAACHGHPACTRADGQGRPCGRCGCLRFCDDRPELCPQCGGCVPCCDCVQPKDRPCPIRNCDELLAARDVCLRCGVGGTCMLVCRVCGLCAVCSSAPSCEDCIRCTNCRPWCYKCDQCTCECECSDDGSGYGGGDGGDREGAGGGEGRGE
jgi:hypothetical protein